jgi:uncharacterized Tic20 family protein
MFYKKHYGLKSESKKLNFAIIVIFIIITIALVISLAPELGILGTIVASLSSIGYLGVLAMILLFD